MTRTARFRRVSRLAVATAVAVTVGGLAACGGNDGGPVHPIGGSPTTTGTATDSPSSTPATTSAGQQKVLAANATLGTALLRLAAAGRTIQTDNGAVPAARQIVNSGVSSARANLKATRAAAYGSSRSCSSVLSHASAARSASTRAHSASSRVTTALNRLRGDVSRLDAAAATVRTDLAALLAAIQAEPNPPGTVSKADVDAALAGASALHKDTLSFVADAKSKTAANLAAASKAAGTATSVAAKAC